MNTDLLEEMMLRALRAIEDNPRHGDESLFSLLAREYPDATQEEIEQTIASVF